MYAVDQTQLLRSVVRDSYYEFVKEFWHIIIPEKPVWNWHIELMCDEIQKVMERVFVGAKKEYDLIFNIAPGSSKSSVCSVFLLPWCWTWMPQFRSLNGSHTHELVLDLSRKSREVVYSDQYREMFPQPGAKHKRTLCQHSRRRTNVLYGGWEVSDGLPCSCSCGG
jgi:hypothetical protein